MKFDPFNWAEIEVGANVKAPRGRVWVRCSERAAFYVTVLGYEVLAGTGHECDLTLKEEMTVRVEAPEGARAFMYVGQTQTFEPTGEKFTNADRKPLESGSVMEVRRALRELELKQRQFMLAQRRQQASTRPQPEGEPGDPGGQPEGEVAPEQPQPEGEPGQGGEQPEGENAKA